MKKKVNSVILGLIFTLLLLNGCNSPDKWENLAFENPYRPNVWTVAVVPFKNDSGSDALSTIAMTDEFYTELASVQDNIQVLSVNQVLAAQHKLGMSKIKSEDDLAAIAEEIGADALFVGKITRYKPYLPPLIGIIVQVYEQRQPDRGDFSDASDFDPSEMARQGKPFELENGPLLQAVVQVNDVFDAGDKDVIEKIKKYTALQAEESPLGVEKVMTGSGYMRFVSYQVIGRLLYDYNLRTTHDIMQD